MKTKAPDIRIVTITGPSIRETDTSTTYTNAAHKRTMHIIWERESGRFMGY